MTTPEPNRLLARSDLPDAQRALLEAGKRAALPYDMAREEERFLARLAALDATEQLQGARRKVFTQWTVWTGLGVMLLAGTLLATRPERETKSAPLADAGQTPILQLPEQILPIDEPLTARVEPLEAPATSREPAVLPRRREGRRATAELEKPAPTLSTSTPPLPSPPPSPSPPESRAPREVEAMSEARQLLNSAPERCLQQLAQIAQLYPRGYLVEEREALTVLALLRTGRLQEAESHAQRFLRSYPDGPYSDRVRNALKD